MSITVLIAEDHHLIRIGLHALIERTPDHLVVGHAVTSRDAVQMCFALRPELLVLDLTLPGCTGVDVVHQVRRLRPHQKILALGEGRCEIDASDALRAGCAGYLLKDASQEETQQAVKAVVGGRRYISQELADALLSEALHVRSPSRGLNVWESLTTRERSVFRLIAHGGTNRSAASTLNLSPKTIEKHRANLMRKLQARSAVELMLLAVELGIVHRPRVQLPGGVPAAAAQMVGLAGGE